MKLIPLIWRVVVGVVVVEGVKVNQLRKLNDPTNFSPEVSIARSNVNQVFFDSFAGNLNQQNVFYDYQTPVDLLTLPIQPKTNPDGVLKVCSLELLNYGFANSYEHPFRGMYKVPRTCIGDGSIVQSVVKLRGDVQGRQFDRFGTLFVNNNEILRFTTAEPTNLGITWKVDKDISDYNHIFSNDGDVYMDLGNLVNEIYTGVIHINVQLNLYVNYSKPKPKSEKIQSIAFQNKTDGWYTINNEAIYNQTFTLKNSSRYNKLELDVFYSNHGDDEFYYFNKDYGQGKSSYREIQIYLDGRHIGSIWPFISIYTGGITLSLWRPISGLSSFNLPSHKLDLTQYLPGLKGGTHKLGIKVVNANSFWLVSTNLLATEFDIQGSKQSEVQRIPLDEDIVYNLPSFNRGSTNRLSDGDGNYTTKVNQTYTFLTLTYKLTQPNLLTLYKFTQQVQFQQAINITQDESVNDYYLLRTYKNQLIQYTYKLNFDLTPSSIPKIQFNDKFLVETKVKINITDQMLFKGTYREQLYPNNGYRLESDLYLDLNIQKDVPINATTTSNRQEYFQYHGNGFAERKAKAVGNNLAEGIQLVRDVNACSGRGIQAKDGYLVFDKNTKDCGKVDFPPFLEN